MLTPGERVIVLRESRRLGNFVRRWRWAMRARIREKVLEDLRRAFERK